jgi:hypothetical protein
MIFTLKRLVLAPTSLLGEIWTPTGKFCYSLEPRADRAEHPCIPAGAYSVTVEPTHNPRLWTPYPDRCLPHIWVPGRPGIEMHAGNHSTDTEGCVIVGFTQQADSVASSRDAVRALIDLLVHSGPHDAAHRIVVQDLGA